MRQRVQRDAALQARRIVAQARGHPGMREFVRRGEQPQQRDVQNGGG